MEIQPLCVQLRYHTVIVAHYSQADIFTYLTTKFLQGHIKTHFILLPCNLDCVKQGLFLQFYSYNDSTEETIDAHFYGRLGWNGSKNTKDLQDGSIYINTVTFNDTGTYMCMFQRILLYPSYRFETNINKSFILNVVPQSKNRRELVPNAKVICLLDLTSLKHKLILPSYDI